MVTETGHGRPELLGTCTRIRREALPIFYLENRSKVPVPDYDGTLLVRCTNTLDSLQDYLQADSEDRLSLNRAARQDELDAVVVPCSPARQGGFEAAAFDTVDIEMKDPVARGLFDTACHPRGVDWDQAQVILAVQRPYSVKLDEQ